MSEAYNVCVIIPCYKVARKIEAVINRIPEFVSSIIVVDDACPEGSGRVAQENCRDDRLTVIYHEKNLGVGGAMVTGYLHALKSNATIFVKLDGDGQMDPDLISGLINPINAGLADFTKGNRFIDLDHLSQMPKLRLIGNAALSFLTKFSCGYWHIFDPTNGFIAIHRIALERMPLDKLDKRYFFESDFLFRLYLIRAVVVDVPMKAHYADESSNLEIKRIIVEFLYKNVRNTLKRIAYIYLFRDFSLHSIQLILGVLLLIFGLLFGSVNWLQSTNTGIPSTAGTVMLAALPIITGIQFLLNFLAYDYSIVPKQPLIKS